MGTVCTDIVLVYTDSRQGLFGTSWALPSPSHAAVAELICCETYQRHAAVMRGERTRRVLGGTAKVVVPDHSPRRPNMPVCARLVWHTLEALMAVWDPSGATSHRRRAGCL